MKKQKEEKVEIELDLPEELIDDIMKLCKKKKITFDKFVEKAVEDFILSREQ